MLAGNLAAIGVGGIVATASSYIVSLSLTIRCVAFSAYYLAVAGRL
jgi:hypothetical protein